MRLPRTPEADSGMGLTPLVDIVFLLLIFFVVATSFKQPHLSLELPSAETAAAPEDQETLLVELRKEGGLFVDGEETAPEALDAVLRERAADVDVLELRADHAVNHGRVVEVLDRARANDLDEISIAVEAKAASQ